MPDSEEAKVRREQCFKNLVLIIQKADPKITRFYRKKDGSDKTTEGGSIVRDDPSQYELCYPPALNLRGLYGSLDERERWDLTTMAAHQTRRESPFCRYTPLIFVFIASAFSFRRAAETVLEYLQMDDLGWLTLLAISNFLAHSHPLASDDDLDAIASRLLDRVKALEHETYEQQRLIFYNDGGFGNEYVEYWRSKNTAQDIVRQIRDVQHMRLIRGFSDSPALRRQLADSVFKSGDAKLDELLENAQTKFLSGDPELRKEAIEKLWDGWERLKTLEPGKDKKDSVRILLDKATSEPTFRRTLDDEAIQLTSIGNNYMIRHAEVGKAPITSVGQVDYLFYRMFSLIRLLMRATGRGG
jgi:hypothetical protein